MCGPYKRVMHVIRPSPGSALYVFVKYSCILQVLYGVLRTITVFNCRGVGTYYRQVHALGTPNEIRVLSCSMRIHVHTYCRYCTYVWVEWVRRVLQFIIRGSRQDILHAQHDVFIRDAPLSLLCVL